MTRARIDRRQLLRGAGLAGGGLFLPSLLGDRNAYAAVPKRIFFFHTQHGPNYWDWSMRPGNLPDKASDWEADLNGLAQTSWSSIYKPLYEHRSSLLILDGLANTAAFASKPTNNHNAGNAAILTGAKVAFPGGFNNEGTGGGPSVDQIIGSKVQVAGRKASLYASTPGTWSPIYSGSKAEIRGPIQPSSLFLQVKSFNGAGLMPVAGGPVDKVALARSTLADIVRPEYQNLAGKLSGEDKIKLQHHLDLMNDLQKQLKPAGPTPTTAGASCNFQTPPSASSALDISNGSMKILIAALACQVTNVAVQVVGQLAPGEFGGTSGQDVHQDVAHQSTAPGTTAATLMKQYYIKHAEQFANLVAQMKAIPEGNGTMLDNTVLVWTTELANGPHDMFRIPAVIAGAGQGYFKTGRYLKYAETGANPASGTYGGGQQRLGPANNKLLVSLMQYMGLSDNSIGGLTTVPGNLVGKGELVDLTGPLPRLHV